MEGLERGHVEARLKSPPGGERGLYLPSHGGGHLVNSEDGGVGRGREEPGGEHCEDGPTSGEKGSNVGRKGLQWEKRGS